MRLTLLNVTLCAVLLTGCQKEATGQVAAVVNGEEVTFPEINAELARANVPASLDKKEVQNAALQKIIERRLLADSARDEGLDKSQEFIIRKRQLEDALLVQLLGEKLGRTTSVPKDREIDEFMKKNPGIFANRTIYQVDRIQFPAPKDPSILKSFADDHSMDAVAARLKSMNIEFDRQTAQMDSARVGEERLKQITGLPQGEPFIVQEGPVVTVGVITGQRQVPVSGAEAKPLAAQAIRNKSLSDSLRQRLEAQKAKAKIEYGDGFAPPSSNTLSGPGATPTETGAPAK